METCKAQQKVRNGDHEPLVEKNGEPIGEPHYVEYEKKKPGQMLAMVGEKLLGGKEEMLGRNIGGIQGIGFLNSVE